MNKTALLLCTFYNVMSLFYYTAFEKSYNPFDFKECIKNAISNRGHVIIHWIMALYVLVIQIHQF